ncbi:metal ABC transporter permease, partial [Francisella tularensis]|uniref:metal ABC transporter permease n=1 Tax=Francisella tularensis TaxID=263 RepID=UPI002381B01E
VFSLLIGPAAIATQWVDGFYKPLALSTLISVLTVWSGIVAAYYSDVPISFFITTIICILYLISILKNKFQEFLLIYNYLTIPKLALYL